MRLQLLALAVASLGSATAFAQSKVTIYGPLDVGSAWAVRFCGRRPL